MLKPTDPAGLPPIPDDERPIGELVHELIENGKAYAKAEVNVVKAMATSKVSAVKTPAILFGAAYLLLNAAIVALAVGVALGLATVIGPLAGGAAGFLLFAGLAGLCGWIGYAKLRDNL